MKMTKNCCRLCFEEKFRPIGIFTTKGIRLKIVEIIQKHFPDEVNNANAEHYKSYHIGSYK